MAGEPKAGLPRRWVIMVAFALNCASNAFMFMDFTSVRRTDRKG
jgi:hypothetical protein